MNYNCLHIIFPPGLGGHHLANLISLSGQYKYDVDYDKYFQSLTKAHFEYQDQEPSIFLHHFGSNSIRDSDCKNFLIIGLPETNQLAINRFNKCNYYGFDRHITNDIRLIYKQHILDKIYKGNYNTIMADMLFDTNAEQLIAQVEDKLQIVIENKLFAYRIHYNWIKNLQNA